MLVKQHLQSKILPAVMLALAAVLFFSVSSLAVNDTASETANTLKVSPVRTDVEIAPGASKTVKITVTNPSDFDVTVRPVQNDFIAGDEDGTPALILEEDEFAPSHSLKRFLQPLENVAIAAGESETVEVVVEVPENAEAGGYFGAVRFAPVSPDDGGQVNLSPSVASLILLTVSGEVTEKLDLTEFAVAQSGNTGSFFTSSDNIAATVRFENPSDVQLAPFGKVSVTKGDELVYATDFNSNTQRDMILPDSARRWSIPLENIDGFGQYTVSATLTYGSDNQSVEVTKSFWVVPIAVIVAAVAVLLALIGAIVGFIFWLRRRNRSMSLGKKRR